MRDKIKFTVVENNVEQGLETYRGEYRNLMFLLKDKFYPEYFGECGGMGRCATCVIKVNKCSANLMNKERNEPVTLSKFGFENDPIRLSCQILITADLNGAVIEIFEV